MWNTIATGASCSLLLALTLTPVVRWASKRLGYVAYPRQDRWHQKPTSLFGGVGIFVAFLVPFAMLYGYDRSLLFLMVGATVVFGLGVIDDLYRVQPYTKLVVQIVAAGIATFGSFVASSQGLSLAVIALTIFWLVALTNAFNLLDNMDGLSAGTACIASLFLLLIAFSIGNYSVAFLAAILCGATLGFLFYNFNPATIFMGDSGSMFIGFMLASLTVKSNWEGATSLALTALMPVLVLAVPIFDTTFVTLVRWMNGRSISIGGRDHTSHRLVAFGLSERKAVLLFYLISVVCGAIAFLGVWYNALLPALLGTLMVIGIVYFGMFLSGIVTYGTESEVGGRPVVDRGVVFEVFLMHKRKIFEVVLFAVLTCLAYFWSFVIRYDGDIPPDHFRELALSLPLLLPLKLVVFSYCQLYRGVWRYFGIHDLIAILKAVTLSSAIAIAALTALMPVFHVFPLTVLVIDWMTLLLLLGGARLLIHVIREYLAGLSEVKGKRVVIVGAGDAGELVLREMRSNVRLGCVPVAFFDDDPEKQGRRIHGIPVLGGRDKILESVERLSVDQIIIAIPSVSPQAQAKIINICQSSGLPVTVMPSLADLFFKELSGTSYRVSPRAFRTPMLKVGEERAEP